MKNLKLPLAHSLVSDAAPPISAPERIVSHPRICDNASLFVLHGADEGAGETLRDSDSGKQDGQAATIEQL